MDPRMTANGDHDDDTPPELPLGVVGAVRELRPKVDRHGSDITDLRRTTETIADGMGELSAAVGALMREVGLIRKDMADGFARIGSLADTAFRQAETSSHDLSEFKLDVRKAILMKLNWPSALVAIAVIGAAFAFTFFHVPQPDWLVALEVAVGGLVLNQIKPALTSADKP